MSSSGLQSCWLGVYTLTQSGASRLSKYLSQAFREVQKQKKKGFGETFISRETEKLKILKLKE